MSLTKEDLQAISELMDGKLKPLKSDIAELKDDLQSVRISQLKVELEQYPRIQSALDGIVAGVEKSRELDKRVAKLELKAQDHDVQIFALEHAVKAR